MVVIAILNIRPASRSFFLTLVAIMFSALWITATLAETVRLPKLAILVPAERGGGWDLTAKAMADTLQKTGAVETVEIEYSPGAGGLIGLAQFIASRSGQGDALLIGGMFTIGAVVPNRSIISLLDTVPVARLTWDNTAVAVNAASKIHTLDDLVEAMISAPESITWAGGSKGGGDEMILLQVAKDLGISASRLHYTAFPGGGEVGAALASGHYEAGISGYSEFEDLVEKGKIRIIAMTGENNVADVNATSFSDLGIEIERLNWRGVFAPPGIDADALGLLDSLIADMVKSREWQDFVRKQHWQDAYLNGLQFTEFVAAEQQSVSDYFTEIQNIENRDTTIIGNVLLRRYAWAIALGTFSIILIAAMFFLQSRARHREEGLQHAYEAATGEAILRTEELERSIAGIHAQIEHEFEKWGLSSAESEIALLMLKGLRLKEIATMRGTSERTVRQQAQMIYRKAGLSGRSDLAAYFIEDFMQSMDFNHKGETPKMTPTEETSQ